MSATVRDLIEELRRGAEMSPEDATSIHWRERIRSLAMPSVAQYGLGLSLISSAARTMLLQRGQIAAQGDLELCGVLVALANILDMEITALETATRTRAHDRREVPYYLREGT